ncbi:hypothetical protein AMTR_s00013p00176880 [Amborella trichopoda]|uniref:Uncharacterized protein n=1 Tax=Amborella trichopoda TaxID=13333 RepID=W1PQC5_AMBTC|nr:hypothetical protein AMTR_s00013p00176880 [Amborella trichopoda]
MGKKDLISSDLKNIKVQGITMIRLCPTGTTYASLLEAMLLMAEVHKAMSMQRMTILIGSKKFKRHGRRRSGLELLRHEEMKTTHRGRQ